MSWTDPNSDEEGHELERNTGPFGTFEKIADLEPNVENYTDTGLNPSTQYCYRVRAFRTKKGKKGGTQYTDYSNTDCATTDAGTPPPAPGQPQNLMATTISSSQIDLTWDDLPDEDEYRIEYCESPSTSQDCSNFGPLATNPANDTDYSDTGLSADTRYCYQVIASNAGGDSPPSAPDCATTDPPPPPGQCDDNGVHDPQNDPGDYGITATQATFNNTWLGVRGNDPATCGIKAWFFGLDTGVDSDHPDLNVTETVDFTGTNGTGEDDHGHGSHTAGTAAAIDGGPAGGIVGMAPGAAIHGFKVCTSGGSCPGSDIIAGVD